MKQFYEENESFATFVNAYATKHHIPVGVALTHKVVVTTAYYYGYRG